MDSSRGVSISAKRPKNANLLKRGGRVLSLANLGNLEQCIDCYINENISKNSKTSGG